MIRVDQEKCIRCGVCTEVCPVRILSMGKKGPVALAPRACIACGHCVAVCPQAAIDNVKAPLAGQIELEQYPVLDADTAQRFLRSRRSIRCYQQAAVPRNLLLRLVDMARFAPTGGNTQGLSYIVIENKGLLQKISEAVVDWMEQEISSGAAWSQAYEGTAQVYRKTGRDVILRDAPHLIVATAPKAFPIGRDNTRYSLAYAEVYATALGLGTCWAGFFELCAASGYPPLLELLQIDDDKAVTGGIMVGYPKYKYQRLVERNAVDVTWL